MLSLHDTSTDGMLVPFRQFRVISAWISCKTRLSNEIKIYQVTVVVSGEDHISQSNVTMDKASAMHLRELLDDTNECFQLMLMTTIRFDKCLG